MKKFFRNIGKSKKIDPTVYHFEKNEQAHPVSMQIFYYDAKAVDFNQSATIQDIVEFPKTDYISWLNLYGIHETEKVVKIAKRLHLHHLSIQDIFDIHQRPKFSEFENYFYFNIKSKFIENQDELHTEQISFVLGKDFLVSFQEKIGDHFQHLRERILQNKGIVRERGADYLLFLMLEAILIEYNGMIDKLIVEVEDVKLMEVNQDPSPHLLKNIEYQKKKVQIIRKAILPIKEFCSYVENYDNPFIEKTNLKYFKDIKDYCQNLLDDTDEAKASLEANINLFFSIQSHRMNQVMKILTMVSTIFIPLTFIAGIYGMNFLNMPELEWKYGYYLVLALFLVICMYMLVVFKRKKWF